MSRHHPSDDLLVEYAAGTASASMALCVNVHLKYCPRCQNTVERLAVLGGLVFESQVGVDVDEKLFDGVMQRIDAEDSLAVTATREPPSRQARRLLAAWLPTGNWQTLVWKRQWFKVYEFLLEAGRDGQRLALQKLAAGGRVPRHGHHGREVTVILQGGFSDAQGVYEEGDFVLRETDQEHRQRAMENCDCICLALLEAPVRLSGPLGHLLAVARRILAPATQNA